MEEGKEDPDLIGGTIVASNRNRHLEKLRIKQLDSVSSATLTAITSAAPFEWHEEIKNAWTVFESARERDLELMTRDPEPIRRHITVIAKSPPRLPDKTIQSMAEIVLRLRNRRRERRWWIAGIILTAAAGPLLTLLAQRIFGQ